MKRYILYPQYLPSSSDSDVHFIGYGQLIKLYGLPPSECINGSELDEGDLLLSNHEYIHLNPIMQGNYKEYLKTLQDEVNSNTSQTKHM